MNGKEKQTQYAILMNKLKKATDNEFYYEAIFIEYAIFEDRTESILRHANISTIDKNGNLLNIEKKLNRINSRNEFQDKYIKKHITTDMINDIINWKNERNTLIHALVKHNFDYDKLKNIALKGECLVKKFSNKSQLVNKYLDKNQF